MIFKQQSDTLSLIIFQDCFSLLGCIRRVCFGSYDYYLEMWDVDPFFRQLLASTSNTSTVQVLCTRTGTCRAYTNTRTCQ